MRGCDRIAFVGGGGKTTLLYAMARRAVDGGAKVLITTTTHMWPHPGIRLEPGRPTFENGISMLGRLDADGKVRGVDVAEYLDLADLALVEADGSRGLPLKAPAEHEPAVPPWANTVIAVAGLDCLGQRIAESCHRPERVCALLGKGAGHRLAPEDVAEVLASPSGGRKNVGERAFRCVLNKADDPQRWEAARQILEELARRGVIGTQTHFQEKERGGLCWF